MNLWDWIIIFLVAAAIFAAVCTLRKNRKNGCSCGCASCPHRCETAGRKKVQQ